MTWHTTSPTLLLRVRDADDHVAWSEFDRVYGELVVRYCRSRGLSAADAEDVRQIVLMNLARAFRTFDYTPERGRFRSYLGRVVRTAIIRLLAHRDRAAVSLDEVLDPFAGDGADELDETWEREWVHHHLRTAMQTVRRTFDARSVRIFEQLLAGEPVAAVARELGISENAVHKVKQRLRDRLRVLIADQISGEERCDVSS